MKISVTYDITEHLAFRKFEQFGLVTPELDVEETWLLTAIKKAEEARDLDVLSDYDFDRLTQLLTLRGVLPKQGLFRIDIHYTKISVVG